MRDAGSCLRLVLNALFQHFEPINPTVEYPIHMSMTFPVWVTFGPKPDFGLAQADLTTQLAASTAEGAPA